MQLKHSLVSDPAGTLLNLFMGGDIEIVDFHPPPMEYLFEYTQKIPIHTPPTINLILGFRASATLDYALASHSRFISTSFDNCLLNNLILSI